MNVGIAGVGKMGRALAGRLIDTGCSVAVWNRTAAAARDLLSIGVRQVNRPVDLWQHCDVVFSSLQDDQAVLAVYLGEDGLFSQSAAGKLALDTSTVQPGTAIAIAHEAAKVDCEFLDCPVLGTTAPARQGQLIAMVGATKQAFEPAEPFISLIAQKVHHFGPVGTGSAMKLSINILMTAYWAAFAESLALADKYGIGVRQLLDVITASPAALAQLPLKQALLCGESDEAGFTIDGVVDLLATIKAAGSGLRLPIIEAAQDTFGRAADAGVGKQDVACVGLHHRELLNQNLFRT